uniref:Cytochrome P450 2B11-like n=1 Tax=Saccoglossus kowalevskii TaxID=10224 RepID=A0ABM0MTN1_SACKO|nr:PREDICTED: cytochrome P450 2B11-like [Saccoglossus kowalevskii]
MVLHPEIQDRVFNEIDQAVGANRLPRLDDRKNLSYTEATLLEIQRFGSIAPLSLPHCALKDTSLGGYTIPKGTELIILLCCDSSTDLGEAKAQASCTGSLLEPPALNINGNTGSQASDFGAGLSGQEMLS